MFSFLTSENLQRYTRVLVYTAAGALIHNGVAVSSSAKEAAAGAAVFVVNLLWTIYGNRILAKLNEIAKAGEVQTVIVNDPTIAAAAPSAKVVSN